MDYPLITIGFTAYNASANIAAALESALAQDWPNKEIVVVDDGSRDDTLQIIAAFADRGTPLRVFSNAKNLGVGGTRNRIIAEASGQFLAFFDDDDWSDPRRLRLQYLRITSYEQSHGHKVDVICHTARGQTYPNGKYLIAGTMGSDARVTAPNGLAVAERVLAGRPLRNGYGACATCSQMARLSLYLRYSGFDPSFRRLEDTEFNIRLAKSGVHFIGVAEPLVQQKMIKTSNLAEEFAFMRKVMAKHRDVLDKFGLYDYSLSWLAVKELLMNGQRIKAAAKLLKLFLLKPFLTLRKAYLALPNMAASLEVGNLLRAKQQR